MGIESTIGVGRRLIATTLLDRCRILDRTLVRDATGGKKEIWTERTRTIVCRFTQPKDDDPVIQLDSVYGRAEMVILLPLGTVFHEGDRVRNLRDNRFWQIVRDVTVPSELQIIMRAGIRAV